MSQVVAFITGTSTGIGNSLARHLLSDKNVRHVSGIGRRQTIEHEKYTHLKADFTDLSETSKITFQSPLPQKNDTIVLVNNSGVIDPVLHTGKIQPVDIINHMNVNLTAPMVLTNNFIARFNEHQGPKLIINVSSGAASNPYDGWACYCSSKAGLEMFARVVDNEQKINLQGFKIFSIAPGVIDTPMQDKIRSADQSGFSNLNKFIKLKKTDQLKDPDKIAKDFSYIIYNHDKVKEVCISL